MSNQSSSNVIERGPTARLESVQLLRGLAAMLVVFNHAGLFLALDSQLNLGPSYLVPSEFTAKMGAMGVDLFFVISGFVMALSARRFVGRGGAAVFLAQRYVRIAPLFYLACLVMLANLLRAGSPVASSSVFNSLTFVPIFDDETYSWPLHYLGWTLAFEFVFYLIVAVLIATGRGGRSLTLLSLVIILPILGYFLEAEWIAARMFTNPILWEFGLGVVACILYERRLLKGLRVPLIVGASLALFGLLTALWLWPEALIAVGEETVTGETSTARVLCWGVPAFFFFCVVISRDDAKGAPVNRLLKLLGDASYSIYLSHLFVILVIEKVLEHLPVQADFVVIITLIVSAAAGVLVYLWIEKPLLSSGQRGVRNWSLRHIRQLR